MGHFIRTINRSEKGIALFLLLSVVLVQLATTSPELHRFLHGKTLQDNHCCEHSHDHSSTDNGDKDHVCGITLFANGITPFVATPIFEEPDLENHFYSGSFQTNHYITPISLPEARAPPINAPKSLH